MVLFDSNVLRSKLSGEIKSFPEQGRVNYKVYSDCYVDSNYLSDRGKNSNFAQKYVHTRKITNQIKVKIECKLQHVHFTKQIVKSRATTSF